MIAGKLGVSRGALEATMTKIKINAIFDDDAPLSLGFVYSTGVASLRSETNYMYEFIWFGRRNLVKKVSHTMNFLASRIESGHAVSDKQLVESVLTETDTILWRINAVSESRNQELLDQYAVKCCRSTTLFEITVGPLPPAAGDTCFVEHTGGHDEDDGSMIWLSRELPSGRIIRVDTQNGDLLKGRISVAAVDMNYLNVADGNLECVDEKTARQMLMAFEE